MLHLFSLHLPFNILINRYFKLLALSSFEMVIVENENMRFPKANGEKEALKGLAKVGYYEFPVASVCKAAAAFGYLRAEEERRERRICLELGFCLLV